jgi:hypothetical protein
MTALPCPVVLTTLRDLARARVLIYRIFMEELDFRLTPGDRAGRRCERGLEGPMLVDDFDAVSVFFGLLDPEGELVAVHRASAPLGDAGEFQIERYGCTLPPWLARDATVELNRLAIVPEYRGGTPLRILLNFEMEHFIAQGLSHVVTAAAFPRPGRAWIRMGMQPIGLPSFKMNPLDGSELTALYVSLDRVRTSPLRVVPVGDAVREAA